MFTPGCCVLYQLRTASMRIYSPACTTVDQRCRVRHTSKPRPPCAGEGEMSRGKVSGRERLLPRSGERPTQSRTRTLGRAASRAKKQSCCQGYR